MIREVGMRFFVFMIAGILCLFDGTAYGAGRDKTFESVLQEQYNAKKARIQQLFNEKIEKIGERSAIPEDLRQMLIDQANEVKDFDIKTLDEKLNLKLKHARQRSVIKDSLKEDAMRRVEWVMENEREFEAKKQQREEASKKVLDGSSEPQNAAAPLKPEEQPAPSEQNASAKPQEQPAPRPQEQPVTQPATQQPATQSEEPQPSSSVAPEEKSTSPEAVSEPAPAVTENASEKTQEEQKTPDSESSADPQQPKSEVKITDDELAEIEAVERGFIDELRYLGANDEETNRALAENSSLIQTMRNSGATKDELLKRLEQERERLIETVKARLASEGGEK